MYCICVGGVFLLQNFFANENTFKSTVKAVFVFIFCIFNFLCLTTLVAFIISKTDFNYEILNLIVSAILAVSSLLNGFAASRLYKENGLICGIFAAFILSLFIAFLSIYFGPVNFTERSLIKSSIIFIAGISGGIIGVNTN